MMAKNFKKAFEIGEKNITHLLIKDKKPTSLDESIGKFENLEKLEIFSDNLKDLSEEILNCRHLKLLSISSKSFTEIPNYIWQLKSLEILKFKNCQIEKIAIPCEGPRNLKNLYLNNNKITQIDSTIDKLENCELMALSGNNLEQLPDSFGNLSLNWLDLDRNQFQKLPSCLEQISTLTHLSLDSNPFSEEEKQRIKKQFNLWF